MSDATLNISNLCIAFDTGMQIGPVDGVLTPGVYHLRGQNGCGKTSLMRCFAGALRPSKGTCHVMGLDVWGDVMARRHLGYVPAHPAQPEFMTITECWQFHATLRGVPDWPGDALVEQFGLDGRMSLAHASAGQRRRAELVAGMAGDPSVLLLDEVFAYLDAESAQVLIALLEQYRSTRVILITAHHDLPLDVDASWLMTRGEPLLMEC